MDALGTFTCRTAHCKVHGQLLLAGAAALSCWACMFMTVKVLLLSSCTSVVVVIVVAGACIRKV